MIGFLGDIHGRYSAIPRAVSIPGVDLWLQVGDLGADGQPYPVIPQYFWFIKGNHENWEALKDVPRAPVGSYMENGSIYILPVRSTGKPLRVAVLGGNFSPKYTNLPRAQVPFSRSRHFLMEEVTHLKELHEMKTMLTPDEGVDVLLTHEAPSPYLKGTKDIGQPLIKELSEFLKPKIHVFGHHHRYGIYDYGGVKTIGLEYGWSHALLWDEATGETRWEALPA